MSDYKRKEINEKTKTINLDLPLWCIQSLDQEALRRGVTRQALIKYWLVDKLDQLKDKKNG